MPSNVFTMYALSSRVVSPPNQLSQVVGAIKETVDDIRSVFIIKESKHRIGVKKIFLHWH